MCLHCSCCLHGRAWASHCIAIIPAPGVKRQAAPQSKVPQTKTWNQSTRIIVGLHVVSVLGAPQRVFPALDAKHYAMHFVFKLCI